MHGPGAAAHHLGPARVPRYSADWSPDEATGRAVAVTLARSVGHVEQTDTSHREGLDLPRPGLGREEFLTTVLQKAAQPICVVDGEGRVRLANRAAIAALGHGGGPDQPAALPAATDEIVARDLDWFVRRDGSMLPVSYVSVPLEMPEERLAVVTFADLEDRVRAERLRQEHEALLAAQRRIATLVAGGATSADVFAAIAEQVADVLGLPLVVVWRYEADGMGMVLSARGELPHPFEPGSRWPLDGEAVCALLRTNSHPERADDLAAAHGTIAEAQQRAGIRACAGAPIIVDGRSWGAISALSTDPKALADGLEYRLAEITELVATAISNTASREEVTRLADQEAALRRVATLVARSVPQAELFRAVVAEVGGLFGADRAGLMRYEPDATVTPVASWTADGAPPSVPERWPIEEGDPAALIAATRRPARVDDWSEVPGPIAAFVRDGGVTSWVGSPILVGGHLWGAVAVDRTRPEAFPPDTGSRLENFGELIATAIANVEARAELAASRARVVAAADEERRRVVRDLHDGAQQRLVRTILTLKRACQASENGQGLDVPAVLDEALDHAERAMEELRELAHGILPATLRHGGLAAAVRELAARMPLPVETYITAERLPATVEATAYFVVSEALTNVAKHARARHASVTAGVECGTLRIRVRDDGVGGAAPGGTGLLGLADRVAALEGQLRVESPAGGGTLLAADLSLPG
jgi:signal transduction histidine kinase